MAFINKKIEIKFDVNWMSTEKNQELTKILQDVLYQMENQLELKNYSVCNLNCKTKVY